MQHIHDVRTAMYHVTDLLDELSAGCDPEFDSEYEELDRQFAELRCQLGNA
jgi:hypothetical protein